MGNHAPKGTRSKFLLVIALLLCLSVLAPDAGDRTLSPPDTTRPWSSTVLYTYQDVSDSRPNWERLQVLVQRRFEWGTLLAKGLRARRFTRWDEALALETYPNLWGEAYGHVGGQYGFQPQSLPQVNTFAHLFQPVGHGFELTTSYDLRRYPEQSVHLFGAGIVKYIGAWYLRAQTRLIPLAGEVGTVQTLAARRSLRGSGLRDYVELRGGLGRGIETIGPGPQVVITQTYFVSLRARLFVTPWLGVSLTASYSDDDFFTRRSLSVGLTSEW